MTNLLATELKQLREESMMKQKQVAKLLGITAPTYSRYESGFLPERIHVVKLAEIFNTNERHLRSLWLTDKINMLLQEEQDIAKTVKKQL